MPEVKISKISGLSTKVAYFNPVFCYQGVKMAAALAEKEDRCLIVAPQRYSFMLEQFPCHAVLRCTEGRGSLLVASSSAEVLKALCTKWRQAKIKHHQAPGLVQWQCMHSFVLTLKQHWCNCTRPWAFAATMYACESKTCCRTDFSGQCIWHEFQ